MEEEIPPTDRLSVVKRLLGLCKIPADGLLGDIQTLQFDNPLHSDEYLLVELPAELLKEIDERQSETRLVFRGQLNDNPVLCTENRTYAVKEAETTNSLLLVEGMNLKQDMMVADGRELGIADRKVVGMKTCYLELKPTLRLSLHRIREMLEKNPYLGPEENAAVSHESGSTMAELLDYLQGSELQILEAINKMPICCISGRYRWLGFDYRAKIVSDIVELCDAELNWNQLDINELIGKLEAGTLVEVLRKILSLIATEDTGSSTLYSIDPCLLSRFVAETLLRPSKRFNYDDFWSTWTQCLPEGIEPSVEHLKGLAIITETPRMKTVDYFPVEDLPEDPQDRFLLLFRRREKWPESELLPYVQDLVGSRQQAGVLLMKYCRSTTLDGIKYYNCKDSMIVAKLN